MAKTAAPYEAPFLKKSKIGKYFQNFHHKGGPLRSKSYPTLKKKEKKRSKIISKKNLKDWTKWNKKMGGRSFIITCGVIGTLYCTGVHTSACLLVDLHFGDKTLNISGNTPNQTKKEEYIL